MNSNDNGDHDRRAREFVQNVNLANIRKKVKEAAPEFEPTAEAQLVTTRAVAEQLWKDNLGKEEYEKRSRQIVNITKIDFGANDEKNATDVAESIYYPPRYTVLAMTVERPLYDRFMRGSRSNRINMIDQAVAGGLIQGA